MAQPTHALEANAVGFLELRSTTDKLFLMKEGFLARYKGLTAIDYRADLKVYFDWCIAMGLDPLEAKRPHMEFYLRYLEQTGWAQATISRRFGTVAVMYKYATIDELIDKDPCVAVTRPEVNVEQQRRTVMSPLEWGRFAAAAKEMGPMYHAMTCLLGLSALRIAEACSLNIEEMTVEDGYDIINFIGKGGNAYAVPLAVPTMRAVHAVMDGRDSGPILRNQRGHRLTRKNAGLMIRKIARSAKINEDISPHTLRRTFTTTGAAIGVPIPDLQTALRHKNINTTMRYVVGGRSHDKNATHRISSYVMGMSG